MALNLNVHEIIKGPVVSEKATLLNQKLKKLVLKVHPQANKMQIKEALQRLFNVKVEKVNTLNRVGKSRRVRRTIIEGSTTKRVFVTLKEGYSIDIFGQSGKSGHPRDVE
jgi:large subunit ribosomal protein L23